MVQVTPVVRAKIVKKRVTKFKRHQSNRFKRVPVRSAVSCQHGQLVCSRMEGFCMGKKD
jgi:hypothetical protein